MRLAAQVAFWGYVAMLVGVGFAGIFVARWELTRVLRLPLATFAPEVRATLANQYRFLKALGPTQPDPAVLKFLLGRIEATFNVVITYLATLVPNLSEELKIAVVQGAVVGGGLTLIANAPNPAGQALLARFFSGSVSPLYLLAGSAVPTVIAALVFRLF